MPTGTASLFAAGRAAPAGSSCPHSTRSKTSSTSKDGLFAARPACVGCGGPAGSWCAGAGGGGFGTPRHHGVDAQPAVLQVRVSTLQGAAAMAATLQHPTACAYLTAADNTLCRKACSLTMASCSATRCTSETIWGCQQQRMRCVLCRSCAACAAFRPQERLLHAPAAEPRGGGRGTLQAGGAGRAAVQHCSTC